MIHLVTTPVLLTNNIGAKELTHNLVFHTRTNHIEVDHHFIRDQVVQRMLVIDHVSSSKQGANCLTKALSYT